MPYIQGDPKSVPEDNQMKPQTLLSDAWLRLVLFSAKHAVRAPVYLGIRKIIRTINWEFSGEEWNSGIKIPFSKMAFKNETSKMAQLSRIYYNEPMILAANQKLRDRAKSPFTSVGIPMQAGVKDSRSMGHCIQSVVISVHRREIRVHVFYRTTEVVQKFLADLKFLHEKVLPAALSGVDGEIKSVQFTFANLYVSVMWLPLIYRVMDPVHILKNLESDSKFWKMAVAGAKKLLVKKTNYSYRSRRKMHDFFHEIPFNKKSLKKYLKEKGK